MGLFVSLATAFVIGLLMAANPGLTKNAGQNNNRRTEAQTKTASAVQTSTQMQTGGQDKIEKQSEETAENETEEQNEDRIRISAFNSKSEKEMKPLLPQVAVENSLTLQTRGQEKFEEK